MRKVWICFAALLVSSSLPALARETRLERGEAELAKTLNGLVPGKSERCLSASQIDGSRVIEGTAIVYRGNGGKTYVNRPGGAERLHNDDIPVQYVYGSQLCRLDRVTLLDRSSRMQRGFLLLGDFATYSKPK